MTDREKIERVRQQVMRFDELLELLDQRVKKARQEYEKLFDHCTPEDRQTLPIKQQQWKIAEQIVDDPAELKEAVLHIHFDTREIQRAFSELHDLIVATQEEEN